MPNNENNNSYLEIACMKHYNDEAKIGFPEIEILNVFRNTFASEEDNAYYENVMPLINKEIEVSNNPDLFYKYIYEKIIIPCINDIRNNDYVSAYSKYKSSVIAFEETLVKPRLEKEEEKNNRKVLGNSKKN